MKHAILILAHNNFDYLCTLIDYFDHHFSIYIHIDKKSDFSKANLTFFQEKSNVVLVSRKYKANWGGHNLIKAELLLLNEALKENDIEYIHFISGQDVPTKKLEDFKKYFKKNKGKEFLNYDPFPQKKWNNGTFSRFNYYHMNDVVNERTKFGKFICHKALEYQHKYNITRKKPKQFNTIYGGSAWFSLSADCAKYLVNHTKKYPAFYNKLKYTFAPDESYINTVLLHSPFKKNIVKNNLRYIVWKHKNNSFPAILDETDFFDILKSDAFFARKIDPIKSKTLIDKLHFYRNYKSNNIIPNEYTFRISSTGFWKHNSFEKYHFDYKLGKAFCSIFKFMEIRSIIDLGCGPGWYVKILNDAGFNAVGYDGNPYTKELSNIIFQKEKNTCNRIDLATNINTKKTFDVVISLDVGEYIPEQFECIYIKNLIKHSNKFIIISWTIKALNKNEQINCRNNDYIIKKLANYNFKENLLVKNYLRSIAEKSEFKNTIMVFEKQL